MQETLSRSTADSEEAGRAAKALSRARAEAAKHMAAAKEATEALEQVHTGGQN